MSNTGDARDPAQVPSALDEIPIFDAAACFAGEPGALEALARQVRRAQEEIGFYYLTGYAEGNYLQQAEYAKRQNAAE